MNLPGRKRDGQIILWKPFATSTPLKPVSINLKSTNGTWPVRSTVFVPSITQKELDITKSIQNKHFISSKIKTAGKNRSRAYFDLSSSSDEDDRAIENGPLIKISSENNDKIKIVAGIKVRKNKCSIKRKIDNSKCQFNRECPQNDESLYMRSKFLQSNQKKVKQVNKVNVKKTAFEVNKENQKHVKNKKPSLKQKKNAGSGRKRRKGQAVLTDTQEIKTEICTNSSHQLFTDSIQEELMNTLCLTTPEMDEFISNVEFSKVRERSIIKLKKSKVVKPPRSEEYKAVKGMTGTVEKQQRPKRTRQAPKKYWLVNDKPFKKQI